MPEDTDLNHATDEVVTQPVAAPKLPASRFRKLRGHAGEGACTDDVMALTRGEGEWASKSVEKD